MYNIYAIVIFILFDIPRFSVNDLHQIFVFYGISIIWPDTSTLIRICILWHQSIKTGSDAGVDEHGPPRIEARCQRTVSVDIGGIGL